MTTALQLRRGTTAQHATFVGANGEITVDTDKKTLVVNDGVTPGGTPLAREDALTKFVRHDTAAQGLTGTQQGNVKKNIGLGNVNNTADADKPVSTAALAALDGKLDKSGGTLTGPLTLNAPFTLNAPLTLPGNASSAMHAAPKGQVEALISSAVAGLTNSYIGGRGQVFTSSGTFTVPAGVSAVKIRGCGGGGGGGTGGTAGGTTSFGIYCTATGGSGGGAGSSGGTASGGHINLKGGARTSSAGGLCGGSGMFGGAASVSGRPATGYGNGGAHTTASPQGSGGGYFEKYILWLWSGADIAVTVGAGGSGASGGSPGTPGIVVVEW